MASDGRLEGCGLFFRTVYLTEVTDGQLSLKYRRPLADVVKTKVGDDGKLKKLRVVAGGYR